MRIGILGGGRVFLHYAKNVLTEDFLDSNELVIYSSLTRRQTKPQKR